MFKDKKGKEWKFHTVEACFHKQLVEKKKILREEIQLEKEKEFEAKKESWRIKGQKD